MLQLFAYRHWSYTDLENAITVLIQIFTKNNGFATEIGIASFEVAVALIKIIKDLEASSMEEDMNAIDLFFEYLDEEHLSKSYFIDKDYYEGGVKDMEMYIKKLLYSYEDLRSIQIEIC